MTRNLFSPLLLAALTGLAGCASAPARAGSDESIRVGPQSGSLIVIGGGQVGPDILNRFVELAGGVERARIVVIPTAGEGDNYPADWPGTAMLKRLGLQNVTVLHTRDRKIADREDFVAPLREATGVWIPGGRQWRLADSYLGTRTLTELNNVLARGGVIAGTSAGASIQASYMVRGAVEGNTVMMAPGHEEGFGFLRNVAVDQHLLARNRQNDMLEVIARHTGLLGIGLDESTAIVVRGDTAEVVGTSKAAFYNTDRANPKKYFFLQSGDRFDLNRRSILRGTALPPPVK